MGTDVVNQLERGREEKEWDCGRTKDEGWVVVELGKETLNEMKGYGVK